MRSFWRAPLFLATLALSAPVQGAEKLQLTPDNFELTTKTGYWFIEHFSPWCHHCQQFMPLWEEMVDEYTGSGVKLAQVDCSVHGDLCAAHGVGGYPTLIMYKGGKSIGKFEGPRTRERLDDFITDKTSISLRAKLPAAEDALSPKHTIIDPNPHGEVLSLNAQSLARVAQEGNTFVKFFAPWCGHCKKLAPVWKDLASAMQHKLTVAEVNCDEHKSLCNREGVSGFPMLYFYPPGGLEKTEYTGSRKFEAMKAWAERATKPPVQHLSYDDLETVVAEHPVIYLFIHAPDDAKSLVSIYNAARPLLGSPPVYTSSSQQFIDQYALSPSSLPTLLALKDHDLTTPTDVLRLTEHTRADELEAWMLAHRLATALELSEANFQDIMKAKVRPLVVLTSVPAGTAYADREYLVTEATAVAMKWRALTLQRAPGARPVVFVWMDAERWGKWLNSMYGIQGPGRTVIADHQALLYYDTTPDNKRLELKAESIFPALEAVISGAAKAKHSENVVERMARSMNNFFIGVERFVMENTLLFGVFAVSGVFAIFVAIRRLLAADAASYSQEKGRLD